VAVRVRERLRDNSRSLGSMLDSSIDVNAGDVEVGLPRGANRHIIEERLGIIE